MKKSSVTEFIKNDLSKSKMMTIRERHENTKDKLQKLVSNDKNIENFNNISVRLSIDEYNLENGVNNSKDNSVSESNEIEIESPGLLTPTENKKVNQK
jgi:ABC-type uncharacterized transport system fused permease/ATPase subunit